MTRPDERTLRAAANAVISASKDWPPERTSDEFDLRAILLAREWLREHPEVATGFDLFWAIWPNRVAKSAAVKAWKRINPTPELRDRIFADVSARKTSPEWLKDGGKFIGHPASYLNGRRWEDEATKIAMPSTNGYHRPNAAAEIIDQAAAAMLAAGVGGTPLG